MSEPPDGGTDLQLIGPTVKDELGQIEERYKRYLEDDPPDLWIGQDPE